MKRIIGFITCLAVVMSSIVFVYAANDVGTDYIDIGNTESERGKITYENASAVQTNTVDETVHTYRTLGDRDVIGTMTFTLACDSDKTNYLTVKLWGDDTGDGMLWLTDENGNMNISGNGAPARNSLVDRRDWVELNSLKESPQYNGGFIYSTYIIPTVYTKGKNTVRLVISSSGGSADYSATDKVQGQTRPSRGIYALYMTQNANFNPSEHETVTGRLADTAESELKSYTEYKSQLEHTVKDAVNTFKSWQIYGQDNYPSYMEGMITRGTGWQKKSKADTDWKNAYYKTSGGMLQQNMTPLNGYEVFALAYKNAETLGYNETEKAELLERVVKGIDFLVRAQGANGGFYSSNGWIGGPNRQDAAGNNLTGFGLRSVAYALDTLYSDINDGNYHNKYIDGNYLTKYIDSDADGEVETSRRRKGAWEEMAANARDYLTSLDGAGHAPNQDMADIIAALRFNNALKKMNSSRVWDETEIINQLDMALGFKPNIACSSYWVSPKGLILENFGSIQGGYSGDYGIIALEEMSQLAELAEANLDADTAKKYVDLVKTAYESADNFMFTANASVGGDPTLYSEGLTSNRNAYYPGTERYVLDEYAALRLGDKTSLKSFYNFLCHDIMTTESGNYIPNNVHFEDNSLSLFRLYLSFDEITDAFEAQNIAGYDYIMENDAVDEYAWADEMGRNVVIKNGADQIYIALNWRNPIHSQRYYNTAEHKDWQSGLMNNLARVHHKTPRYDKYGYAEIKTVGWNVKTATEQNWQPFTNHYAEAFMYMDYDDYKIIMNSNNLMGSENNISYNIPYTELGLDGVYKDLISGESYYFGDAVDGAKDGTAAKVAPASTMVLCKVKAESDLTVTAVDYSDNTARVSLTTTGSDKVTVYVAEYTADEVLVNVKSKTQTVTDTDEIKVPYTKTSPENNVKIFVWYKCMKPLCEAKEW